MRLGLCIAISLFAFAASAERAAPRSISVVGEAKRAFVPDEAVVQLSLESKDREAENAKAKNDAKLAALYELAGTLKIGKDEMKTGYHALQPAYRYADGTQTLEGYQATTTFTLEIKPAEKVGMVLQKLVETGVQNIGNVTYQVDDAQALREEVMLEAIDNAKAKAERLADRLGEALGAPLEIVEGDSAAALPMPMMMMMDSADMASAKSANVAPPIGTQEISTRVNVRFALEEL